MNIIPKKTLGNRPAVIHLFSGCGGMALGLEGCGFDVVASVEIDPIHSLVHHYNFPYGVTICKDISLVKGQELLTEITNKGFKTDIDLVAGGSPCQGYSYIGRRLLDDPRNKLIFEYARIIFEIKPKYFIFENVPGMASGKHQQFLKDLIQKFAENNYSIVQPIQILDASLYGAPQKRRRLILIGYRNDVPKPNYPFPTHGQNENSLPLNTIEQAISDLSEIPVFIGKDYGIRVEEIGNSEFKKYLQKEYSLCHKRAVNNFIWGHLGSQHTDKTISRFAKTIPGKIDRVSRFFRLSPHELCNTLRAGTDRSRGAFTAPRPIHYLHPRCLSIREAARLHTFPDWFQFHRTIWYGFREIGNAVIPLLAKSLGAEIIKCLNIDLSTLKIEELDSIDDSLLSYNMRQASLFWQVSDDVIPKRRRVKVDRDSTLSE
ncbi:MAG: DNA cytosine methyltransferase [Xenococcaceae cyanobacterium MO_188.B29]|nr:DNA cytosine methyltransferase [Xenococcaceae cyanobacterium MO_188.B29]